MRARLHLRSWALGLGAATLLLTALGACLLLSRSGHFSFTPPIAHQASFAANTANYPTRLSVAGSQLLNAGGQTVVLKGLMPPDPAVLNSRGKFNRAFVQALRATGANVIRIPIHPERWEQYPDYLWRYLDPVVRWSGELGLYVILDLHFIGNVATGAGSQMPDLHAPSKDFTLAFWRQTASYFRAAPNVIFEIVNEPESILPAVWRQTAGEIAGAIRAAGATQLIVVGGADYARDLSWVAAQPVAGENIAYATHIYPAHAAASWEGWFGQVSKSHPVLVTEWGWLEAAPDSQSAYLVGSAGSYGQPLLDYLDRRQMGWVACWYDDEWLPARSEEHTSE